MRIVALPPPPKDICARVAAPPDNRAPEWVPYSAGPIQTMQTEADPICHHCALPVRAGEPRWAAREPVEVWHYRCAEDAGFTKRQLFFGVNPPKAPT